LQQVRHQQGGKYKEKTSPLQENFQLNSNQEDTRGNPNVNFRI